MATAPTHPGKSLRARIVITSLTVIAGLTTIVFFDLPWGTPANHRSQASPTASDLVLESIETTLKNLDQRLKHSQTRFDSLEANIANLQKRAPEWAELETLRDENHRLRVELIQTTQDLFTLSDANLDLQERLRSVDARYAGPPGEAPSAANWNDSARDDLAWGNAPSGSSRSGTDESWPQFVRPPMNANSRQAGNAPGDGPGIGIQLPADHPSTNADCRACHATPEV